MKCEICHINDAQQPIEKIENGVAKEYYVCKSCASQLKIGQIGKYSMADVLFDFSSTKQNEEIDPPIIEMNCPTCGSSFAKIHESHRAGCPDCYQIFKKQLGYMVAVYNSSDVYSVKNEVLELEKKLSAAISDERYEDAAVIRDLIKSKTEAKTLKPSANNKLQMPEELLEAMKKMGIDVDIINKQQNDDNPSDDGDDDSSIDFDGDDDSDDDPF